MYSVGLVAKGEADPRGGGGPLRDAMAVDPRPDESELTNGGGFGVAQTDDEAEEGVDEAAAVA